RLSPEPRRLQKAAAEYRTRGQADGVDAACGSASLAVLCGLYRVVSFCRRTVAWPRTALPARRNDPQLEGVGCAYRLPCPMALAGAISENRDDRSRTQCRQHIVRDPGDRVSPQPQLQPWRTYRVIFSLPSHGVPSVHTIGKGWITRPAKRMAPRNPGPFEFHALAALRTSSTGRATAAWATLPVAALRSLFLFDASLGFFRFSGGLRGSRLPTFHSKA